MVLDCVGGKYWEKNLRALAKDSQWILYGLLGGGRVEGDLLAGLLAKRVHLLSSTLRTRSDEVCFCFNFFCICSISFCALSLAVQGELGERFFYRDLAAF